MHEDNEEDTLDSDDKKRDRQLMESKAQSHVQFNNIPEKVEKTAFKHFLVNKRGLEVSMKKHKAFVSAAKLGVAKNTRGAQKKKLNNH